MSVISPAGDVQVSSAVALKPGWALSSPTDQCNYHWPSAAVYSYAGTPMCVRCVEANGGALPTDLLADESPRAA